jgi:uncharacterized protein (DUF2249 family)
MIQQLTSHEIAETPADRLVDLDVRDDLRNGREPFSRIMQAKEALPAGHVLRLRAIFEPAPLYRVLGSQGFEHWTERLADDDWRVWFWRGDTAAGAEGPGAGEAVDPPADGCDCGIDHDRVRILDVRGLEPPEPMVRTLAALETLPEGHTLVQINVREPRHLLPKLEEMGWRYEVREQGEELVRVFISRALSS